VNDLFEGELTPGDKLVYVNDVIKGKLMESDKLAEQAANNTKEQFANSPDLSSEIMSAVMDALAAHSEMSKQALESEKVRADMKDVLLGPGKLWEGLREKARSMPESANEPFLQRAKKIRPEGRVRPLQDSSRISGRARIDIADEHRIAHVFDQILHLARGLGREQESSKARSSSEARVRQVCGTTRNAHDR